MLFVVFFFVCLSKLSTFFLKNFKRKNKSKLKKIEKINKNNKSNKKNNNNNDNKNKEILINNVLINEINNNK